jgi:Flp pilus assembly pilin Flp
MTQAVSRLHRHAQERGGGLVEYAFILMLVVILLIAILTMLALVGRPLQHKNRQLANPSSHRGSAPLGLHLAPRQNTHHHITEEEGR